MLLRVIVPGLVSASLLAASPALAVIPALPPKASLEVTLYDPPPREVTCAGGQALKVVESASLHPRAMGRVQSEAIVVSADGPPPPSAPVVETLTFRIDAQGRPLDIRRASIGQSSYTDPDASIAALAGWRFDATKPVIGCRVSIPTRQVPLEQASRAALLEIAAFERRDTLAAVRRQIYKAGDCGVAPRRQPKTINYPDLRRFEGRDLNPAWAGVTYDIDADGTPRNVRIEAQGGDPGLADAAAAAVAGSRYQPGKPVAACYGTFAAAPRETPAPPRPMETGERPKDFVEASERGCPVKQADLNLPANKDYPRPYAARKISGWAYLSFDVAPWGQVGNVKVIDSQPSAAFGRAAQSMLWSARPTAPPTGYRGCVLPVFYAIPDAEPIYD